MWFPRNEVAYIAALLPIMFVSKSLTNAETCSSNIEREVLSILHGIEKFHHYCFTQNASMVSDHKPLVAVSRKT